MEGNRNYKHYQDEAFGAYSAQKAKKNGAEKV